MSEIKLGPALAFALALRSGRRLTVGDADPGVGLGVAGLGSGHRWRRCNSCGLEAVTAKDRSCLRRRPGRQDVAVEGSLARGCAGRMLEVGALARQAHGERPADAACCRAGCGRVRFVTTAAGEDVCRVCLWELSARMGA